MGSVERSSEQHAVDGPAVSMPHEQCTGPVTRDYSVYGIVVRTDIPLTLASQEGLHPVDVTMFLAPEDRFEEMARPSRRATPDEPWSLYFRCADGSDYLRWARLFEFLVSADGRTIACRFLENGSIE